MDFDLKRHTGADAASVAEDLTDLYVIVYSEPPYYGESIYSRDAYLERTRKQATRDGFTVITAHADDQLAGFSFGYPFGPGRWWGGIVEPDPPAELVEPDKFAVIELVVAPPFRGRGLSSTLIRELLAGRPEPHATLLVHPDAPARQIYPRWGWRQIGTNRPTPDAPVDHIMVLDL